MNSNNNNNNNKITKGGWLQWQIKFKYIIHFALENKIWKKKSICRIAKIEVQSQNVTEVRRSSICGYLPVPWGKLAAYIL